MRVGTITSGRDVDQFADRRRCRRARDRSDAGAARADAAPTHRRRVRGGSTARRSAMRTRPPHRLHGRRHRTGAAAEPNSTTAGSHGSPDVSRARSSNVECSIVCIAPTAALASVEGLLGVVGRHVQPVTEERIGADADRHEGRDLGQHRAGERGRYGGDDRIRLRVRTADFECADRLEVDVNVAPVVVDPELDQRRARSANLAAPRPPSSRAAPTPAASTGRRHRSTSRAAPSGRRRSARSPRPASTAQRARGTRRRSATSPPHARRDRRGRAARPPRCASVRARSSTAETSVREARRAAPPPAAGDAGAQRASVSTPADSIAARRARDQVADVRCVGVSTIRRCPRRRRSDRTAARSRSTQRFSGAGGEPRPRRHRAGVSIRRSGASHGDALPSPGRRDGHRDSPRAASDPVPATRLRRVGRLGLGVRRQQRGRPSRSARRDPTPAAAATDRRALRPSAKSRPALRSNSSGHDVAIAELVAGDRPQRLTRRRRRGERRSPGRRPPRPCIDGPGSCSTHPTSM